MWETEQVTSKEYLPVTLDINSSLLHLLPHVWLTQYAFSLKFSS